MRRTMCLAALSLVCCCRGYMLGSSPGGLSVAHRYLHRCDVLTMAAAKKRKKTAKGSGGGGGGGFGSKATIAVGPTPDQLLKRATDLYNQLEVLRGRANAAEAEAEYGEGAEAATESDEVSAEEEDSESVSVTKWSITVRTPASDGSFSDWVPVALLNLACSSSSSGSGQDPTALMPSAIGASCKEILESGCQAIPSLRKVARETVQYSFEPIDSFETHVYSGLEGRRDRRLDAAATLGIESGASAAEVKKAHRRLMVDLHPDKFIGDEEGAEAAKERMLQVQDAYAELGGGMGGASGSFYESIGGKGRVSFSGVLEKEELSPLGKQRAQQVAPYEGGGWRAGVMPMSTDITREFVTRNLARSAD